MTHVRPTRFTRAARTTLGLGLGFVLAGTALAACGDDSASKTGAGNTEPSSTEPSSTGAGTPGGTTGPAVDDAAACRADGQTILVAAEAYEASVGALPNNLQDLVAEGLLREEAALSYDIRLTSGGDVELVAAMPQCATILPGTPEWDAAGATVQGASGGEADGGDGGNPCEVERKTLELAVEVYLVDTGNPAQDEAQLVEHGLLRAEAEGYDLVDGSVVPAPGGPCQ